MIYVTGDCHASFEKFTTKNFPDGRGLTKDDYVIVCGDFGYWDRSREMYYWLNWLDDKPFTTLWVDGNHENYDMIAELPVDEWHGGKVQYVRDSIIHLMRGQVYDIEGKKFFTFGGARSHDIQGGVLEVDDPDFDKKRRELERLWMPYRVNHISWWKEEMPNSEEMDEGLKNLEKVDYDVDYIITHCCSSSTQAILGGGLYETDELTGYFEELKNMVRYNRWYFGHYHVDRTVGISEVAMYNRVTRIL